MNRNFVTLLILLLVNQLTCSAAAPLMHLYFASKYLERHCPDYTIDQKHAFFRGTSFPDCHYICGGVKKNEIHDKDMTLEKIYEENSPFEAGKKFHSWIDDTREKLYYKDKTVKDKMGTVKIRYSGPPRSLLKMVEDAVLFSWKIEEDYPLKTIFALTDPEVEQYKITQRNIQDWHKVLLTYFDSSQEWETRLTNLLGKTFGPQWAKVVPRIAQTETMISQVKSLAGEIEQRINAFATA